MGKQMERVRLIILDLQYIPCACWYVLAVDIFFSHGVLNKGNVSSLVSDAKLK